MLLEYLNLQLEPLKKFYEETIQKIQENKKAIDKIYGKTEASEETANGFLDSLIDDYGEQEEFKNLAGLLIVSYNYFILEHFLKLIIGNLLNRKNSLKSKSYKKWGIKRIEKFFTDQGINLIKVKCYKKCNILRLIVNSVKHNGKHVSEQLSEAKDSYKKGEDIVISSNDVDEYFDATISFCDDLVKQLIGKNEALF